MTISNQWKLSLSESYQRLEVEEFLDRVQQLVTTHLKCALEEAKASAYPPVGHTLGKVGKSALGMIQLSPIQVLSDPRAQAILLPTFVVLALEHVFQYIAGVLSDPRPDLQSAISGRLSLLGNRVGNEFESELRKRLGALHGWQERSLSGAAEYYADSAAGWF